MNRTIRILILSDMLILTGFGLISPILAIFIKENLAGGTIFAAGLATFIFWTTKSAVQLPLSKYVDKHDHKIKLLVIGTFVISAVPLLYIFAEGVKWMYLAQFLYGIGSGLAFPCWLGLWSTNLDKHHESFEWSLYSTFVGMGAATAAAIGATIAQLTSFKITFALTSIISFAGGLTLLLLEKKAEKIRKTNLTNYHYKRKSTKLA